jgi:hypothetical protein
MHDLTRRDAIKAASAAGALGLAATSTAQEPGQRRDDGAVARRFETTELLRRVVFNRPVRLGFVKEGDQFFFEVVYASDPYGERVAWVRVEDSEQVLGVSDGCSIRLHLSEARINYEDLEVSARVDLRVQHPGGQVATVIDERISVRYFIPMPRQVGLSGQEKPFVSYGDQDNRGP